MTEPRRDYYVYILFREDRVTPFYVGKGRGRRAEFHRLPCADDDSHKARVARKVIAALGTIPLTYAFTGMLEREAHSAEAGMISALGRSNIGTGILTNLTDGGDGASGAVQSEQTKALKADAAKALWQDDGFCERARAGRDAPGVKNAISESSRALWQKDEHRKRMASSQGARWTAEARDEHASKMREVAARPEVKAAKSVASTARFADEAERERQSVAARKAWSDPELRATQSARLSGIAKTPEAIEKRSAASKAVRADPVFRAAHGQKMREAWARKRAAAGDLACR